MRRILTYRWQRSMRPEEPAHRWRVIAWLVVFTAMIGWWVFSWVEHLLVKRLTDNIQARLGCTDDKPNWWQHGDAPLHILTILAAVLVLHAGRRLFRPAWPWWSSFAIISAIALADEAMQARSIERYFEWHDLACDAIGLVLSLALLWLLGQLPKRSQAGEGKDSTGMNRAV